MALHHHQVRLSSHWWSSNITALSLVVRSGSAPVKAMLGGCLTVWVLAAVLAHTRRLTGEWMRCEMMVGMTIIREI